MSNLMHPAPAITLPHGALGQLTLATAASLLILFAGYRFEQPILMLAAGLGLVAGIIAWSQPFFVCILFVAVSNFRLPEAYPFLVPLKLPLLLGFSAVALVLTKVFLTYDRVATDTRWLRTLCSLSFLLAVGIAYPYAAVRPTGPFQADVVVLPVLTIVSTICIIAWGALLSTRGAAGFPLNIKLFIAYFSILTVSMAFSQLPSNSFSQWSQLGWKIAAMTLVVAWMARSERDFNFAYNTIVISGALVAAVAVYNKYNNIGLVEGSRVTIVASQAGADGHAGLGVLSDPNDLALILLFPLALALARLVHRPTTPTAIVAGVISALIVAAIVATESRGALFGVVAVLGTVLLFGTRSRLLALTCIVVSIPLLFAAMAISDRQSGSFTGASESGLIDESSQGRLEAWHTGVNMAIARPLTGVGVGNFSPLYYVYTSYSTKRDKAAHSMWFEVLAECGMIAFAVFVAMIVSSFQINARSIKLLGSAAASPAMRANALGLQAALAGTCASGTFLSQANTWPIYMITALIAALAIFTHVTSRPKMQSGVSSL